MALFINEENAKTREAIASETHFGKVVVKYSSGCRYC